MDAITFILNEHKKIRKALKTITKKSSSVSSKEKFFKKLSAFLAAHEKMEQTLWYPKLKKYPRLKTPIKHLVGEEKHASKVIKKMKATSSEKKWLETLNKLKEGVSHHAREEETKLFPKVRKELDKEELNAIGKSLARFKKTHAALKRI